MTSRRKKSGEGVFFGGRKQNLRTWDGVFTADCLFPPPKGSQSAPQSPPGGKGWKEGAIQIGCLGRGGPLQPSTPNKDHKVPPIRECLPPPHRLQVGRGWKEGLSKSGCLGRGALPPSTPQQGSQSAPLSMPPHLLQMGHIRKKKEHSLRFFQPCNSAVICI